MKNNRFDWMTFVISLLSAIIVLALLLPTLSYMAYAGWVFRALMTGLITAAVPFAVNICVKQLSKLRKKKKIFFPKTSKLTAFVIAAALFLTGAVGQCLYSIRIETVAPEIEAKAADVMLLLDDSGSTYDTGFSDAERKASEALIDGLTSSTRLSGAVFTTKIDAFSNLCVMDNVGKENLKSTMRSVGSGNGTNLVAALTTAYQTLNADDNGAVKTVILMTDGNGVVPSDLAESYKDAGVTVQVIRTDHNSLFGKELSAFAASVGGSDNTVSQSAGGYNPEEIIIIMKKICTDLGIGFSESASSEIIFDEALLLHDTVSSSVRLYDILIRFAVFSVICILTQYLYFRKIKLVSVLLNLLCAAIACAAVTFAGTVSIGFITVNAIALCIYVMAVRLHRIDGQVTRPESI